MHGWRQLASRRGFTALIPCALVELRLPLIKAAASSPRIRLVLPVTMVIPFKMMAWLFGLALNKIFLVCTPVAGHSIEE